MTEKSYKNLHTMSAEKKVKMEGPEEVVKRALKEIQDLHVLNSLSTILSHQIRRLERQIEVKRVIEKIKSEGYYVSVSEIEDYVSLPLEIITTTTTYDKRSTANFDFKKKLADEQLDCFFDFRFDWEKERPNMEFLDKISRDYQDYDDPAIIYDKHRVYLCFPKQNMPKDDDETHILVLFPDAKDFVYCTVKNKRFIITKTGEVMKKKTPFYLKYSDEVAKISDGEESEESEEEQNENEEENVASETNELNETYP